MLRPIPDSAWERTTRALVRWIPYITLALSTILSITLTRGGETWSDRVVTAVLTLIAAGWVYVMYTRSPAPCQSHPVRMGIYFTGFLAFASVLMARQPFFFIFMITGFFHASLLRPWPLVFVGVGLTSILINTIVSGFPWPSVELWFIYGTIILVQTLTIGLGAVAGEKLTELSEQRREAVSRLEAALEENAELHAQLLTQAREAGVLDERERMAREIHDTIAQGLTGIITQLEALAQAKDRPGDWQRHLDAAARLARKSLAEARRSVEASRPGSLDNTLLPDALADFAGEWSEMSGVPVDVTTTGRPVCLHAEVEVALLRTAQEALANVAKHASASRAGITLSYMGDVVTLDVRDDGIGFDPSGDTDHRRAGFGLTAVRQRVGRVAGTLAIESEPGRGTAICARVPALLAQPES
jgi:signal transduction histidine kinase